LFSAAGTWDWSKKIPVTELNGGYLSLSLRGINFGEERQWLAFDEGEKRFGFSA
jgi:hypothetical protein